MSRTVYGSEGITVALPASEDGELEGGCRDGINVPGRNVVTSGEEQDAVREERE